MRFPKRGSKNEKVNNAGSAGTEPAAAHKLSWRRRLLGADREYTKDVPNVTTLNTSANSSRKCQSLWDQAYEDLKAKDPPLIENYEKLLSGELLNKGNSRYTADLATAKRGTGSDHDIGNKDVSKQPERTLDETSNQISNADPKQRQFLLHRIIEDGLIRVKDRKVVQERVAQAAELLLWAKDWIDMAVQASPQASMAWAAVCIGLPLLTKPAAAEQANRDGFTYVTTRMRYFVALEDLMLPQNQGSSAGKVSKDLRKEFESHVVDLYQHILNFQIRSVLRFYRSGLPNFGRDLIQSDDWKQMLKDIQDLEMIVHNESQQITTLSSREMLDSLAKDAEASLQTMQRLLAVAEEHRDISAKQLSIQEQQLQVQLGITRRMTSSEEKCHQLFRLAKDGKDGGYYEWYKNRIEDRVEGTCEWFLNHSNYKIWLGQASGPLLVSADPGCGKSVLTKYLTDHKLARAGCTVCYFFFKDQDQDTVKQALCGLLHQLFNHKPSLLKHAMPEYSTNGSNLINVTSSLWNILEQAAHDVEAGPVIFALDALDECNEFKDLIRMLKRHFWRENDTRGQVKFLLTSRPYQEVVDDFRVLVDVFPYIRIPGEEHSERIGKEVNYVIKYRVDQLAKEKALREDLKKHLEKRLTEIPHRTYLWVYLVFDHLERGFRKTKENLDHLIDTLPQSVNQAYDKILSRSTDVETIQKVRKALSIMLVAVRPLTLEEMNIAVNIEFSPRSESRKDLNLEDKQDFKVTLRNWCGLFISIYDNKVYFLHQTAREFLLPRLSEPPSSVVDQSLKWYGRITLQQAHSTLAQTCIVYLNFPEFNLREFEWKTISDEEEASSEDDDDPSHEDFGGHTFLDYSAKNWIDHYCQSDIDNESEMMSLVLRICTPEMAGWFRRYCRHPFEVVPECSTTLMMVSYLGFDKAVELVLLEEDLYSRNNYGQTALHLAAEQGHEVVVQLLIDREAVISVRDEEGSMLSHQPAWSSNQAATQLPPSEGADIVVNIQNKNGETALHSAAHWGHEEVVQLLLSSGADATLRNDDGQTALHCAAYRGHEEMVQLLLSSGADVSLVDKDGQTALHRAALHDHKEVVQLLLSSGADATLRNDDGQTALHCAAYRGHEEMVQLLLSSGADVSLVDKDGQTALHNAAFGGYKEVVQLLLASGADVTLRDKNGKTALDLASEEYEDEVIQLLEEWIAKKPQ